MWVVEVGQWRGSEDWAQLPNALLYIMQEQGTGALRVRARGSTVFAQPRGPTVYCRAGTGPTFVSGWHFT